MTSVVKEPLRGIPDGIRAKLLELTSDQDQNEYAAGTTFRELALRLALREGLDVSIVIYDDGSQELEVTLKESPYLGPILIDRSAAGDYCQITFESWLPIDTSGGIESSVNIIHSALKAIVPPRQAGSGM